MERRGQVALFVIIAIVIVATVVSFFIFRNKAEVSTSAPLTVQPIYKFTQDCLRTTAENSLVQIGQQGGYFFISPDINSIDDRIPYYLQGKKINLPNQSEIQNSLAGFVYNELSFCILNFKDFRNKYEVEHELNNVNVQILDNQVIFSLDYPLTISRNSSESVYKLDDFEVNIPIRLDKIYQVSQNIVIEQAKHPGSVCLSCSYDLGQKYNVHIDMLDYGNSTIFTITDDNSKINNESYGWSFAVK